MVFSFDMVYPRRTSTLPSVEGYFTNMNIVKDPPKSIFTRRINKVGSDNKLMNTIRAGSDRLSENVQIYARGVNPFVSVRYSNLGTNNLGANHARASLPYKAFDNGAFYPPAIDGGLTSMLPLSRQNRLNTLALANKSNLTVALNNARCEPQKTVHRNLLKAQQRSARSRKFQPTIENYKVKHVISNPVSTFANSNLIGQHCIIKNNQINTDRFINENYQTTFTNSNLVGNKVEIGNNLPMETFTKDVLQGQFNSIKKSKYTKNIEHYEQELDRKLPVYSQESSHGSRSRIKNNLNRNITLDTDVLQTSTQFNKSKVQGTDFLSRDVNLIPKIAAESRHLLGNFRPKEYWKNPIPSLNDLKLNARYSS